MSDLEEYEEVKQSRRKKPTDSSSDMNTAESNSSPKNHKTVSRVANSNGGTPGLSGSFRSSTPEQSS